MKYILKGVQVGKMWPLMAEDIRLQRSVRLAVYYCNNILQQEKNVTASCCTCYRFDENRMDLSELKFRFVATFLLALLLAIGKQLKV
jgi:hypothetical protein